MPGKNEEELARLQAELQQIEIEGMKYCAGKYANNTDIGSLVSVVVGLGGAFAFKGNGAFIAVPFLLAANEISEVSLKSCLKDRGFQEGRIQDLVVEIKKMSKDPRLASIDNRSKDITNQIKILELAILKNPDSVKVATEAQKMYEQKVEKAISDQIAIDQAIAAKINLDASKAQEQARAIQQQQEVQARAAQEQARAIQQARASALTFSNHSVSSASQAFSGLNLSNASINHSARPDPRFAPGPGSSSTGGWQSGFTLGGSQFKW